MTWWELASIVCEVAFHWRVALKRGLCWTLSSPTELGRR